MRELQDEMFSCPRSIKLEEGMASVRKYQTTPEIAKIRVTPLSCTDPKTERKRTRTPVKPVRRSERNKVHILNYMTLTSSAHEETRGKVFHLTVKEIAGSEASDALLPNSTSQDSYPLAE